jgi:ketosteroid isomerase-like protein
MTHTTALSTIEALVEARNQKDLEKAFSYYEKDATIVFQPGQVAVGEAIIKTFIQQVSSLSLTFHGHEIFESGDIALHLSQYTLDMGENGIINGRTADVLRRQSDGTWLIAIDNAWAGSEPKAS